MFSSTQIHISIKQTFFFFFTYVQNVVRNLNLKVSFFLSREDKVSEMNRVNSTERLKTRTLWTPMKLDPAFWS